MTDSPQNVSETEVKLPTLGVWHRKSSPKSTWFWRPGGLIIGTLQKQGKWSEVKWRESCLVMSNSLWPHGLQPARLLCPWDSPVKNPGMGYHSLLQEIFPTQGSNPGLPHCRHILYCLSHQRSPLIPKKVLSSAQGYLSSGRVMSMETISHRSRCPRSTQGICICVFLLFYLWSIQLGKEIFTAQLSAFAWMFYSFVGEIY